MRNHGKQGRSDKGQSSEHSTKGKDKRAEESSRIAQRTAIEGRADLQLKPVDLILYGDGLF